MEAIHYLMNHGLKKTMDYSILRVSSAWNEWYLSIDTCGSASDALDTENQEYHGYDATSYPAFKALMKHIDIKRARDVFVDYGAGKGRVVVLAAKCQFKRVIGVELSPGLAEVARENVRKARRKLRCQAEIVTADATTYPLPDDANILHFFNPFKGEALSRVIRNIQESFSRSPRPLTLLFGNADHFEEVLRDDSVANDWITSRQDVLWPHYEQLEERPDSNRYRIYRICPDKRKTFFA